MALSFNQAMLVWARAKPADEPYEYDSTRGCAICQFLNETGRAKSAGVGLGGSWWDDFTANRGQVDERVNGAAAERPHTFGAFAKRLEGALA